MKQLQYNDIKYGEERPVVNSELPPIFGFIFFFKMFNILYMQKRERNFHIISHNSTRNNYDNAGAYTVGIWPILLEEIVFL